MEVVVVCLRMIKVNNLNFAYGTTGRGIFDINFEVRKGQVVGFLGPNGAGKTTTIRCILGFLKGDTGNVTVNEMDSFKESTTISEDIGYIAGEPAFPDNMTGLELLKFIIDARVEKGFRLSRDELTKRMQALTEYFQLDSSTRIKRMSKGMKQKTAIISALMHDPEILILDEPTSGLDPLMQARFIEIMQSEKRRGKTILISSHMFEEIERTADRVLIIKDGRIIEEDKVSNLKKGQRKIYTVVGEGLGKQEWGDPDFTVNILSDNEVEFNIPNDGVDKLLKMLGKHKVLDIFRKEIKLEQIFMQHYKAPNQIGGEK